MNLPNSLSLAKAISLLQLNQMQLLYLPGLLIRQDQSYWITLKQLNKAGKSSRNVRVHWSVQFAYGVREPSYDKGSGPGSSQKGLAPQTGLMKQFPVQRCKYKCLFWKRLEDKEQKKRDVKM